MIPLLRPWLSFLLLAAVMAADAGPVRAASFLVTTTADHSDGACNADCSLRDAVVAANAASGPDEILVPAGIYTLGGNGGEDQAASGDLDLRESVAIIGAGASTTIVDGGGVDRVFDIVESGTVTFRDLTIQHGKVPAGDTQGGGGILWSEPVSGKHLILTLDGVDVVDNDAGTGDGGGLNVDQDDPASALVTIVDSTFADNAMSDGDGGGLHLCCDNLVAEIRTTTITQNHAVEDPSRPLIHGEGGGIYHCCSAGRLTIIESTISDNEGPTQGGGIYTCCGTDTDTLTTLQRTTVSGNRSLGVGTLQGFGGGIEAEGATTVVNSTLSGNDARQDGGGIENEDVLVLRNVTIASNQAGRHGGGVFEKGSGTTLGNTLLAGNTANGDSSNCDAAPSTDPLASNGGNLSSDATCTLAGDGDRQSLDPLLDPLGDNGGPTATHAFPAESPAVDGGTNAGCPPIDQRLRSRPADGDGDLDAVCDVGAYERGAATEDCTNGVDDDGNGRVDCDDFACAGRPTCLERCGNCVDDDGDGFVDRDDPDDCEPPLDGGGAGVGDPGRGKLVTACAATTQKVGAKLAAAHLAALHACVTAVGTCVQKKPGDGVCLTRAGDKCERGFAKLGKTTAKAEASLVKACEALTTNELRGATGMGYLGEAGVCDALGIATVGSAAEVAACLGAHHRCIAQELVGLETPRARELFALAGVDATTTLACAFAPADGGGRGLGEHGKAAVACEQAIGKAGTKLVAGTLKLAQRCTNAVVACRQRVPGDQGCVDRARTGCSKSIAKLDALATTVAAAVAKRCDEEKLGLTELLGSTGAGFQSQAALCHALGAPTIDSVAALGDCLVRHHRCRSAQLLEVELPRTREFLTIGGVALP